MKYPVQIEPLVGEVLKPVSMSEEDFITMQGTVGRGNCRDSSLPLPHLLHLSSPFSLFLLSLPPHSHVIIYLL